MEKESKIPSKEFEVSSNAMDYCSLKYNSQYTVNTILPSLLSEDDGSAFFRESKIEV